MGLFVSVSSTNARPSSILSGGTTTISIAATATPAPAQAMARYVIDAAVPFVFGQGSKEMRSNLVLVSVVGTTISSTLQLVSTSGAKGIVPIDIFVGERDAGGQLIGQEFKSAVDVDVQ